MGKEENVETKIERLETIVEELEKGEYSNSPSKFPFSLCRFLTAIPAKITPATLMFVYLLSSLKYSASF